jgi:hypothetical protein
MRLDPQMLNLSWYATALVIAYQDTTNTTGFPLKVTALETGHIVIQSLDFAAGILIQPHEWRFKPEVLN